MKKNKILIFILIFMLLTTIFSSATPPPASYTRTFNQLGTTNSSEGTGRSPARSGTNDSWIVIISKLNQPRIRGTNPHIGVDIFMSAGSAVYSAFPGTVSDINTNTSQQLGYVTVYSDINGDGTKETYIRYQHIVPANISIGSAVTVQTQLGVAASLR